VHKLAAEKNALIETVKRLNRELAKLEAFRRSVVQSVQVRPRPPPRCCLWGCLEGLGEAWRVLGRWVWVWDGFEGWVVAESRVGEKGWR